MTSAALLRSLEKAGVQVVRDEQTRPVHGEPGQSYTTLSFFATHGQANIRWHDQNGRAICVNVSRVGDESDYQSDYFAGSYYRTIKGAVEAIKYYNTPRA